MFKYACVCMCMYVCVHVCACVCMCVHVCVCVYVYTYIYTYMYVGYCVIYRELVVSDNTGTKLILLGARDHCPPF